MSTCITPRVVTSAPEAYRTEDCETASVMLGEGFTIRVTVATFKVGEVPPAALDWANRLVLLEGLGFTQVRLYIHPAGHPEHTLIEGNFTGQLED